MKLIDLDPQWIDYGTRRGIGVRFRCMTGHCKGYLWILLANPLDGGPPHDGQCFQLMRELNDKAFKETGVRPYALDRPCDQCRWQRTGEGFATMSLAPSVDAHACGHLTLNHGSFS